ncbi:hypothetical protein JI739_04410 [Ramlibacter sp. AW1]|uniref:Pilus assembly protein n=1 Tax=Ramlibacter aurantiacus TaxID=2801330 RepID=A0A937D3Q8_9BURK|nr:hypothetical protein [Ramlibacter aurantiacus]MBL0419587.1 hypothetical protein [Ramlibacter aurantiacus]
MKNVTLVLATILLAGCGSITPQYDTRFGDAVRQARMAQTLNPNAGTTPVAVGTLDGRTAREASDRYQETYKAPPPVVNVINIGGSLRGQ